MKKDGRGNRRVDVESIERRQYPLTDLVESAHAARGGDGHSDGGGGAQKDRRVEWQHEAHGDHHEPELCDQTEPDRRGRKNHDAQCRGPLTDLQAPGE